MELTTKTRRHEDQPADFSAENAHAEELATQIVDAAIKVHKALGPGLLESVYAVCFCRELAIRGIPFKREVSLPICYEGIRLESGLRLDILVDDCVIVELKTVETVLPVHEAQLLSYLKLTGLHLGFLLNFHVPIMKNGIKRFVL